MNEILSQSIFFGIAITLVTYEIGLWIKQKTGKAIANPLLISVILIVAVLLLFHIDYETYANGAQYISIFLTPATVSLAVPLYRQLELLKTYPKAIFGGFDTTHCKMQEYAKEAEDPKVKQFFEKGARSAMVNKQQLMKFLQ